MGRRKYGSMVVNVPKNYGAANKKRDKSKASNKKASQKANIQKLLQEHGGFKYLSQVEDADEVKEIRTVAKPKMLPTNCTWCDETFESQQILRKHTKINKVCRPFFCQCCGRFFYSLDRLESHSKHHQDFPKNTISCGDCGTEFSVTGTFRCLPGEGMEVTEEVAESEDDMEMEKNDKEDDVKEKDKKEGEVKAKDKKDCEVKAKDKEGEVQAKVKKEDDVKTKDKKQDEVKLKDKKEDEVKAKDKKEGEVKAKYTMEDEVKSKDKKEDEIKKKKKSRSALCQKCHRSSLIPCPFCQLTYRTIFAMSNHCVMHRKYFLHGYPCAVCDQSFSSLTDLEEHLSIHVGKKVFLCTVCGLRFDDSSFRNTHVEEHKHSPDLATLMGIRTDDTPDIKCSLCGFLADDKTALTSHMSTSHPSKLKGKRPRPDPDVQLPPQTSDTIQNEANPTSSKKPKMESLVPVVEKSAPSSRRGETAANQLASASIVDQFKQQNGVTKRKPAPVAAQPSQKEAAIPVPVASDNQKKIPCPFCKRSFSNLVAVVQHCAVHEEYIFYNCVCNTCGEQQKSVKTLSVHLSTHEKNPVHLCPACGERFPNSKSCSLHLSQHTDVSELHRCLYWATNPLFANSRKTYVCSKCGDSFTTMELLIGHDKDVHQKMLKVADKDVHEKKLKMDDKFREETVKVDNKIVDYEETSDMDIETDDEATMTVNNEELKRRQFLCQMCTRGFKEMSTLVDHCHDHEEFIFNRFQCPMCPEIKRSLFDVEGHISFHEMRSIVLCGLCCKKFVTQSALDDHQESHRGNVVPADDIKEIFFEVPKHEPIKATHRCSICKRIFAGKLKYNLHMRSVHQRLFICRYCDNSYSLLSSLATHCHQHDEFPLKGFLCNLCLKRFASLPTLEQHMSVLHEGKNVFICSLCGELFDDRKKRAEHEVKHGTAEYDHFLMEVTEEDTKMRGNSDDGKVEPPKPKSKSKTKGKTIVCKLCDCTFKSFNARRLHMSFNHLKWGCCFCSESFPRKIKLVEHIRKSHKAQCPLICSFRCNVCNKTFDNITELEIDLSKHESKPVYLCCICGKKFDRVTSRKSHEDSHMT